MSADQANEAYRRHLEKRARHATMYNSGVKSSMRVAAVSKLTYVAMQCGDPICAAPTFFKLMKKLTFLYKEAYGDYRTISWSGQADWILISGPDAEWHIDVKEVP